MQWGVCCELYFEILLTIAVRFISLVCGKVQKPRFLGWRFNYSNFSS